MCGILFYKNKNNLSAQSFKDCLSALSVIDHRGPDGEGGLLLNTKTGDYQQVKLPKTPSEINDVLPIQSIDVTAYNVFLGHKRLSIIDLSPAGHQPMISQKDILIFNGEIYNYIEIKNELKALGHFFNSDSDSEVLIAAYRQWGKDCLQKFNGMWAFVLWDGQAKEFFISNDRFGVKPLYLYENNAETILSSEIKQIKQFREVDLKVNQEVCDLYLQFSEIGKDTKTLYNYINRFRPGHFAVYKQGVINQKSFYSIFDIQKQAITDKDAIEKFRYLIQDATAIRTRSDVPWGVGLSGGLDSSIVLLKAMEAVKGSSMKPFTFSAVFPGEKNDESYFAERMASEFDVERKLINPLETFDKVSFDSHLYHQELPPISTSFFAQYKVAELVRRSGVTVNLVGQGADEIFGGYHAHFYRYCRSLILKGKIITYIKEVGHYADIKQKTKMSIHKIVLGEVKVAFKFKMNLAKYNTQYAKHWNNINFLTEFMKNEFSSFQLPYYLHSDDRTSMAFSVETRHPFMDYRMVEFAYSLPENLYIRDGWSKYLMREASPELPDEIRWRKDKKGFVTPQDKIISKLLGSLNTKDDSAFRHYCLDQVMGI